MVRLDPVPDIPVEALVHPVFEPSRLFVSVGTDKKLHLHLLEFARAEDEIAGRDLVAKRFAGLRHAERELDPLRVDNVGEVGEDSLRSLGTQVDGARGIFNRPHERPEHQVELPRLGQFAAAFGASVSRQIVGAKTLLAAFAIDHRVGEILQMT